MNEKILQEIRPFWVSIFARQLDLDNDSIATGILQEYSKTQSSVTISNVGGWQSPTMNLSSSVSSSFMKPLLTEVCNDVRKVAEIMGASYNASIPFDVNYWFNINKRYNYNKTHHHSPACFSAVYYVKVPEDSGKLNFHRPDLLRNSSITFNKENEYNCSTYWIPSKVGALFIFPSYLSHYVTQNLANENDDTRISIAFNF
jgi:uncharacterized protein (TIGR02466 family)